MSSSSPSLQPQSHESDVVLEDSLSLETPNQSDPLPKSDPKTNSPPPPLIPDTEENIPAEVEGGDDEEGDEMYEQKTLAISSGIAEVTLTSLSNDSNTRRGAGANKRKKGKGKGKPKIKKRLAIEEKLRTLMTNLNPIPFIPLKILDFAKHEKLLKKLGLWDFVHIDFDRNIRADLIAQLVATYEVKSRASYVNDCRIMVNRADLARAFKLPLKKEKGNVASMEVDSNWEALSDDSIGFIVEFVSDWMLLHEDMWLMPNEVLEWLKVIKDGHPEKVDWAALFWFMVEKELKQGGALKHCYYSSHLQHLIKYQRGEELLRKDPVAEAVKLDAEANEEEDEVIEVGNFKEDSVMEGPNTELTLGQDGEKEEEIKDVEMMEVEKCKESEEEEEEEEGDEEEQGEWLLHGKNNLGDHFMQRCSAENVGDFGSSKDEEEEMDGDEDGDHFHGFTNEGDGFTGNLLEAMEANQMAFTSQDQLHNPSSVVDDRADMQPSFFNNVGKRAIGDDNHIPHHSVSESNKRLRLNDSWEHNKPLDFGMCMEQIQQMTERARMFYEEKEQNLVQSNMNQQILLTELQKRDAVIEHLHKTRLEETQKKDGEIYRLERELYLMGSVLDGYRKALKEVQKTFAEYKEKTQLHEAPTYKDVGSGGLMLTAGEIEKLRKKQEEEYKMNCLLLEQKMKEAEEDFADQFDGYIEKVNLLGKRLTVLEAHRKKLIELYAKRKLPQTEGKSTQVTETQPIFTPEEKVPEVAEPLPSPLTEEKMPETAETIPQTEEKVPETAETIPQTEEKVPEIAEPLANE